MNKKAVVTGGAGFIGSHLVRELLAQGYEVHVVDNYAAGKKEARHHTGALYHEVDIRNLDALHPIVKGTEYVFHLAALPRVQFSIDHPRESHDTNVGGTFNVLLAARDAGVARVVYSSSSSAYGEPEALPMVEHQAVNPASPYGLQKYMGELTARMFSQIYNLPTVSLRYFNVYGPGADPDDAYALVIPKFLGLRLENKPLTVRGDGTNSRDYTHVRDVVRANLLAAEASAVGAGEVINIGAGRTISIQQIAELIGGPVVHVDPVHEPRHTLADNGRAKELLGWEPTVAIEDGIKELKKLAGLVD